MKPALYSLIILLYLFNSSLTAQDKKELLLIEPTGTDTNGFPVMRVMNDSSARLLLPDSVAYHSFMGDALQLYYILQQYLVNTGTLTATHPAFLAVTHQQGGFARQGFYLAEKDETLRDESDAHYVDLTAGTISSPPGRLESVTQIYPHELGHIMLAMLTSPGHREMESYNVNMHYFSVITDYSTAFNEGFAEHIENVSVLNEPNAAIKQGKYDHMEELRPYLAKRIRGFKHDCLWPLRPGFYKAAMPVWYQQYENFKRYVHAVADNAAFLNANPDLSSIENMLTWRNTGIDQVAGKRKNTVQLMSTEGFVSTFLTHLAMSELPAMYRPAVFYKPFLADTTKQIIPDKEFSPVQNLFIKYFYVYHHYVGDENSSGAPLMEFIDGYLREFPDEAAVIRRVYRELTGEDYISELPPPIWMIAKDYEHRVTLMDPFGASTVPLYSFDINAAEAEDLMTIKGIDRQSAEQITAYRNSIGFFHSLDQVNEIPGLAKTVVDKLKGSKMDESYFNSIPDEDLSIQALIITPLLHLLKQGMLWFIVIALAVITLNYRDKSLRQLIFMILKFWLIWMLFLFIGLAAVVIRINPYLLYFIFVLIYLVPTVLILRNKKKALKRNLIVSGMMAIFLLYFIC